MFIKKSSPNLHKVLSEIAKASKNFWNYPEEWMKFWEEDLMITEKYIKENEAYHFENEDKKVIGFYSFFKENENIKLEHLFILPEFIGKGIGKILMEDFFEKTRNFDFENIILEADPNAESFYKKFGFETIELKPTKIEGRFLPIMIRNKN